MPLAMKCHINNEKGSSSRPPKQTWNPGSQSLPYATQIWIAVRQLVATYNFADHGGWLPKLKFFSNRPWCRDLGSNGPKNQHSLEEQFWNFATTPLIVAPVRMITVATTMASKTRRTISAWWLASNLKQMPLAMKCHINSSSTMRKDHPQDLQNKPGTVEARSSPTQICIPLRRQVATYISTAKIGLHCETSI